MIAGILFIISGLLLNQWFLAPITHLGNGQTSLLRIIIIWAFDITVITQGLLLLTKKKKLSFTPKNILFIAMTLFLILVFSESMLHVIVRISPTLDLIISNKDPRHKIPDEKLGHRPKPNYFEHDSNGFRNKVALSSSDIVAIGDSQTYGAGVKLHEAWPHQLSSFSGQSVYSLSSGGYGSVEALILLKTRAIQLNPKLVVFAMYDGNDLWDAYEAVYILNLFESLRSTDPLINDNITTLQQLDSLLPLVSKVTRQVFQLRGNTLDQEESSDPVKKNTMYARIKQLKLFQLFFCLERTIQKTVVNTRERRWQELSRSKNQDLNIAEAFQIKNYKTILTPACRAIAMDLAEPRIEEGLRITLDAIREMKKTANDHSIEFLLITIPLKERVFYELFSENGITPSQPMQELMRYQDEIRRRMVNYLQDNEISYIDTLPILKKCFDRGRQPFFVDADSHLNFVGQKVIAKAVHEYIQNENRKKNSK